MSVGRRPPLVPAVLAAVPLVCCLLLAAAGTARAQAPGSGSEEGVSGLGVAGLRLEPDESPRETGFELFTARVGLSGTVAPGIEYRFQAGAGDDLSGVELLDARLTLPLDRRARLSVGQFKAPFSEEALRDRRAIRLVERSQAVSALAPGRQVGLEVAGAFLDRRLTYRTGLFNGEGRTSRNPGGGFLWTGRVEYNSVGPAEFYDELVVQVGMSAAAASDGAAGSGGDGNFVGDRLLLGGDARITYRGFVLEGEYVRGEFRPDSPDPAPAAGGSDEVVGEGWYAGAGYSLWRALDLMVRWDSYRAPAAERRDFVVLGTDLWVGMESRLGFHLAFQTDGPEVFPVGTGFPAASAAPGGLTDGQAVIRLQVGF